MLRIAAAPVAAPKPAFFGSWRPELIAPLELNSAFCSAMPVGLLKVAVVTYAVDLHRVQRVEDVRAELEAAWIPGISRSGTAARWTCPHCWLDSRAGKLRPDSRPTLP